MLGEPNTCLSIAGIILRDLMAANRDDHDLSKLLGVLHLVLTFLEHFHCSNTTDRLTWKLCANKDLQFDMYVDMFSFMIHILDVVLPSLKLSNSHLKICRNPTGKDRFPSTIFQGHFG